MNLKLHRSLMVLQLSLLTTACRERDSSTLQAAAPPILQCNAGESPLFFGLQASSDLPSMESLNIPVSIYTPDRPNRFEPSINREKTLRLDLCYEESTGKVRLDKIVQKDAGYGSHANWLMAKTEGLEQLVFDQNVASLDIELELRKGNLPEGVQGVVLKGAGRIVYFYLGENVAGQWKPYTNLIYGGNLTAGDPFAGAMCSAGETFSSNKIRLGSALISFERCSYVVTTGTTGSRIIKLQIDDSDPSLPIEQKKLTFEGENKIKEVLTYIFTHHNFCDSFKLALPGREIIATSSSGGQPISDNCGPLVENAPPPGEEYVRFRTSYGGQPFQDRKLLECHSFFSECP
ncbi:MAG: hypothetical protein AB7T49_21425 [Oligoflexales bacterium]